MTERERIIEIIMNSCRPLISPRNASRAADALLESGLIALPCERGQSVWIIRNFSGGNKRPVEGIVSEMFYRSDMELVIVVKYEGRGIFGETVFLTREEAEAKLREKSK